MPATAVTGWAPVSRPASRPRTPAASAVPERRSFQRRGPRELVMATMSPPMPRNELSESRPTAAPAASGTLIASTA